MRIAGFAGALCVGLPLLMFFPFAPLAAEPFDPIPEGTVATHLFEVPRATLTYLKVRHAATHERYDVGVFGNSRFLPVGEALVEGRDETFFNFAIGGENFRNSVAMVERLVQVGKLPEVLVVQMDSFATPGDDNPESDGFVRRMQAAWRDLVVVPRTKPVDRATWLAMVSRYIIDERQAVHRSMATMRAHIGELLTPRRFLPQGVPGATGYRQDGSRTIGPGEEALAPPALLKPWEPKLPAAYFVADLERLAELASDARLILVEVPLEPRSDAEYEANPTPAQRERRALFVATCERLGLTCVLAPQGPWGESEIWPDATHPPEDLLTEYLGEVLQDAGIFESSAP